MSDGDYFQPAPREAAPPDSSGEPGRGWNRRTVIAATLVVAGVAAAAGLWWTGVIPGWLYSRRAAAPSPPAPEPFAVVAVTPMSGEDAPRNALVRVFLNRPIEPADAGRARLLAVAADGATQPVPSSLQAVNDPLGDPRPTVGSLVIQALCRPGQKGAEEGACWKAGTSYRLEIDPRLRSLDHRETLACNDTHHCAFTFTVGQTIDTKPPRVSLPEELSLPIAPRASVPLIVSDESGVSYLRLTFDRGQLPVRPGTLFTGPWAPSPALAVDTSAFTGGSRHFLTVEAYDVAGHRTEAAVAAVFYPVHCFDQQLSEGETEVDCGGPDCQVCRRPLAPASPKR